MPSHIHMYTNPSKQYHIQDLHSGTPVYSNKTSQLHNALHFLSILFSESLDAQIHHEQKKEREREKKKKTIQRDSSRIIYTYHIYHTVGYLKRIVPKIPDKTNQNDIKSFLDPITL